jgi:hypothetical protein
MKMAGIMKIKKKMAEIHTYPDPANENGGAADLGPETATALYVKNGGS